MSTLHERLGELADLGAPVAATPSHLGEPATAWQRGVRYRRRRRIGTAAIVVVALVGLAGLGGLTLVRADSQVAPAGSNVPAGLPDRFHSPSPWLAGTDEEGPLGQLAAILPATRGSWTGTSEREWVGISATTGEYRFLDLPDRAEGGELSPDGRRVAYWTTGEPSGTPNTAGGQSLTVGGVAVRDTTTGETTSALIESEHGVAVDDLHWADDDTLVLGYGFHRAGDDEPTDSPDASVSTLPRWQTWRVEEDALTPRQTLPEGVDVDHAAAGRVLTQRAVLDLDAGARTPISYRALLQDGTALDPSGARVALPGKPGPNNRVPAQLQITSTDGTTSYVADSSGTYAALWWVDETHVAVQAVPPPGFIEDLRVDLVDITDGSRETLIETYGVGGNTFQLATDLLGEPTVAAVEPPSPLDPRWVTGGLVGIVLVGGIALVSWRRRVAP